MAVRDCLIHIELTIAVVIVAIMCWFVGFAIWDSLVEGVVRDLVKAECIK